MAHGFHLDICNKIWSMSNVPLFNSWIIWICEVTPWVVSTWLPFPDWDLQAYRWTSSQLGMLDLKTASWTWGSAPGEFHNPGPETWWGSLVTRHVSRCWKSCCQMMRSPTEESDAKWGSGTRLNSAHTPTRTQPGPPERLPERAKRKVTQSAGRRKNWSLMACCQQRLWTI